jgi:ubiquinone/menaquinone biosynthesis C-methylase UbiE
VTGLDLSPYFLAVAELRERQAGGGGGARQRVRYMHADMEHSGLPDGSFDLVSIQFVTHELPGEIIKNLVSGRR